MDLKNIPSKKITVYNTTPEELNSIKINVNNLSPMVIPNFSDYNCLVSRASIGLNKKRIKKGKYICYNKIGIICNYKNVYANDYNSFDIINPKHIPLIDKDNTDGIQCIRDFLNLKIKLVDRFVDELQPFLLTILKDFTTDITIADLTKIKGFGYSIIKRTKKLKIIPATNYKSYTKVHKENIEMYYIKNPCYLEVFLNGSHECSFSLSPLKKSVKGQKDKVILQRSNYWGEYDYIDNINGKIFPFISLTDIDLTDGFEKFILKYNEIINEFNDEVEILKNKYLAMYMLNSIGLKSSLI